MRLVRDLARSLGLIRDHREIGTTFSAFSAAAQAVAKSPPPPQSLGVAGATGVQGAVGPIGSPGIQGGSVFTTSWISAGSSMMSPGQMSIARELEDIGTAIEPFVGVRDFSVKDIGGGIRLLSRNGAVWSPRKALSAVCGGNLFSTHDPPYPSCTCGVYAYTRDVAKSEGEVLGPLFGEVYLWGDVLVHDHGYRAEHSYPKCLYLKDFRTRAIVRLKDELEDLYGIPVTLVPFGTTVSDILI